MKEKDEKYIYVEGWSWKGLELIKTNPAIRLAAFAMINELLEWRRTKGRTYFPPVGYYNPRSLLQTDELVEEYKLFAQDEEKKKIGKEILELLNDQTKADLREAWARCQEWYNMDVNHPYQGPWPDY